MATKKSIIYGYCRISRKEQSIDRQIRNIEAAFPDAIIRKEAYTGTKVEGREVFNKLLKEATKAAKAGTQVTIVFDSVSRMSRNADDGIRIYFDLYEAGIDLVFLKEPGINTATYAEAMNRQQVPNLDIEPDDDEGELVGDLLAAVVKYQRRLAKRQIALAFQQAQKEVDDLRQRTREGLITARINGKQIGQTPGAKVTTKKSIRVKELIRKYHKDFGGSLNDIEAMRQIGDVSRNTFYKYKRELLAEVEAGSAEE